MRRRDRIYYQLRRGIVIILVIFSCIACTPLAGYATSSLDTKNGYSIGRNDNLTNAVPQTTSKPGVINSDDSELIDPVKSKEAIDTESFNNDFIDTAIYIIGGLAGFMMMLQIAAFCFTKVYPSTNRFFEKLKFIGIDGYDRGFVVPTIKILLLGILSFFCISGLLKQIIAYILGWFVITFG